jgi:hypothetical protein
MLALMGHRLSKTGVNALGFRPSTPKQDCVEAPTNGAGITPAVRSAPKPDGGLGRSADVSTCDKILDNGIGQLRP